jgi:cystathionine beta-lyase/cystathionine gamma-synthase
MTLRSQFIDQPATSLGGVESLVEHRLGSDPGVNPSLVRLSIGVEEFEVSVAWLAKLLPTDMFLARTSKEIYVKHYEN